MCHAGSGRLPRKQTMSGNEQAGEVLKGYGRIDKALEVAPVSKRTFLRWQAQHKFPVTKVGRVTLYKLADIERFLAKHTIRAIV